MKKRKPAARLAPINIDDVDFSTFDSPERARVNARQSLKMQMQERKRLKTLKVMDCDVCVTTPGGLCPGLCQRLAQMNAVSKTVRKIGYLPADELPAYDAPECVEEPEGEPSEVEQLTALQEKANEAMRLSLEYVEAEERLLAAKNAPKEDDKAQKPAAEPKKGEATAAKSVSNASPEEKAGDNPPKKGRIPPIQNPFPGIIKEEDYA